MELGAKMVYRKEKLLKGKRRQDRVRELSNHSANLTEVNASPTGSWMTKSDHERSAALGRNGQGLVLPICSVIGWAPPHM